MLEDTSIDVVSLNFRIAKKHVEQKGSSGVASAVDIRIP